jgi:hypothetical protein
MHESTRSKHTVGAALFALGVVGCGPGVRPVVIIEASEINTATSWDGTYEIRNSVNITGALTLAPCTELRLAPSVTLSVRDGGSIRALGTAACPVRIVSAKPVQAAGDWERIDIYQSASNNSLFQHTEIRHGNGGQYGALWVESRAAVGLSNVRFAQISATALMAAEAGRFSAFESVSFDAVGSEVAKVGPVGLSSMTRVTVTNTMNPRVVLDGTRSEAASSWRNLGVPLEVPTMEVRGSAVEIEAGSVLRFKPDAVLSVRDGGSLRAMGTMASPITFESAKDAPAPGDWRRVEFYGTSGAGNLLRNVAIRHAGDTTYGVLWIETGATLAVESVTLSMNSSCDARVEGTLNETGGALMRCAQ